MIPALIAVIAAAGGAYLVYQHWDQITAWLSDYIPALKAFFEEKMNGIAYAAAVFAEKVKGAMTAIKHKLYYKEDGKWFEEVAKREVPESEVPPFVLAKIAAQEVRAGGVQTETDITHEMEQELSLTI